MKALEWIKQKLSFRSATPQPTSGGAKVVISGLNRYSESINSPEQAMRLDAVYQCVAILSGTIAAMPLRLLRRRGEVFEYDEDSTLNYLFSREANPRQSFFVLMQNAIISILLRGNAYILPLRDGSEIKALYLLDAHAVQYDIRTNTYTVYDETSGAKRKYEAREIIHLKNKSLDGGYLGVSTIQYAGRTLAVSANADEQTLDGFKRGNRLKGFLAGHDVAQGFGSLSDKAVDDIAERLEGEIAQDKAIMRLPGTVNFIPLSISPADAQLLENRKFGLYSICRFFGVHPDMVFVESGAGNYKASENSQITFLNQTLRPLLAQIEAEFSCKLIDGSPAVRLRRKISFDLMSMYASDLKSRAEYYKVSVEAGIMTPNEIRQLENRQPIEGGDTTFISCNVAPITSPKINGTDGTAPEPSVVPPTH